MGNVQNETKISLPSILVESKCAVTPMNGFTRFSGTMEIAPINNVIRKNRVDAIANSACSYYPNLKITEDVRSKATFGFRAISADGLPYIGRSNKIKNIVINILSIIENELNFSEEEINFTTIEDIASKLNEIQKQLQEILLGSTFGEGRIGEHRVVILGISNAGKSSLFNAIIGHDRSIISAKPGTTRDTVESYINICGISVCLIDTAGFWESKDPIDKISIKKSSLELNKASLCLIVDEKNPKKIIQSDLFKKINKPYLLIQSKCDNLSPGKQKNASKNEIRVSAKKGHGIQTLLTMISTSIKNVVDNDPSMLASITRRQRALIEESLIVIQTALTECSEGERVDILASILHEFVSIMEGVLGRIAPKEVLNNIFSNFCIGK